MLFVIALLLLLVTLPGTLELLGLTVAALLPTPAYKRSPTSAVQMAILIPAHNEEKGIEETLKSLKACNEPAEIIVIADNCTDQTAHLARAQGVRVLERTDSAHRGKDYALRYALDRLLSEGHAAYLILDADSSVAPNFLTATKEAFSQGAAAVQVRYIAGDAALSWGRRLLNVGMIAFNVLRPLGRARLGLSAGCLGNGFGISRTTLLAVPWRVHSIVEDIAYHLQLVYRGLRVQFLEHTAVFANAPVDLNAFVEQRRRWEGGRLKLLWQQGLPLFRDILRGKFRLIEPLLDLLTAPLSYHCLLLLCLLLFPFFWIKIYALFGLTVVLFHVLAAIGRCGGEWRDYIALLFSPFYLIGKGLIAGKIFKAFLLPLEWIRTKR